MINKIKRMEELRKKYPVLEKYYEVSTLIFTIVATNFQTEESFQRLEEILKDQTSSEEQMGELARCKPIL